MSKPSTPPAGDDQTLLGQGQKPEQDEQQDKAKAAADVVPALTGIVRVKALKAFWAGDTVLVETGKSVDLPAEEAERRRDLDEVEILDQPEA